MVGFATPLLCDPKSEIREDAFSGLNDIKAVILKALLENNWIHYRHNLLFSPFSLKVKNGKKVSKTSAKWGQLETVFPHRLKKIS